MPVYLLLDLDIFDPETFARYQAAFPPIAARHGGRYVVRGGDFVVSGDWGPQPRRLVMLEFPDREAIGATMADPEYQPLIPIRESSARMRSIVVDGVGPSTSTPPP
jgi:uncharacterized protein (DUF1330 family)